MKTFFGMRFLGKFFLQMKSLRATNDGFSSDEVFLSHEEFSSYEVFSSLRSVLQMKDFLRI